MENKSGPFSKKDKKFIRDYVDSMSIDDIATHLKRNPSTIETFIENNRLGQKFQITIANSDRTQNQILVDLKSRPFFHNLKNQFTDKEIEYFCEYWVMSILDFGGNILSYEELELKEWLTFEILKNRELSKKKLNDEVKESLKEELREELDREERDKARVQFLQGEIAAIANAQEKSNKEFSDLADKANKIRGGLVKSREQRTKDHDAATIDFPSLIKILQKEYDVRRRMGQEMEVIRMSEEKKRKEMYELHEYADGELDVPILNAESADLLKEI